LGLLRFLLLDNGVEELSVRHLGFVWYDLSYPKKPRQFLFHYHNTPLQR
jgi:hypothetical protein